MVLTEQQVRKKLKGYALVDIYFLKSEWRKWIRKKQFENFEKVAQRPNVQNVYKLFEDNKIFYIDPARYDRYKARITYHKTHDIVILFQFNYVKDRVEVVTYYSEEISRRKRP